MTLPQYSHYREWKLPLARSVATRAVLCRWDWFKVGALCHKAGNSTAAGVRRNFGYHSRNRASSRPSSIAHRLALAHALIDEVVTQILKMFAKSLHMIAGSLSWRH